KVSEDYLDIYLKELAKLEDAACDELLDAGGDVTLLTEEETQAWREETGPAVREAWASDVASVNPDVDANAFFETYQQTIDTYAADSDYETAMERCAARS